MKKITNLFFIPFSAVFIFLSCTSTKTNLNSAHQFESRHELIQLNKTNFFFAHKGISSLYPENTMSAFKEAARLCCKGIELDIQETYDGIIIISHSESAWPRTNSFGDIKDCTFEQIQRMKITKDTQNLSKPEHFPSLEEYCQWVKNTKIFN